MASKSGAKDKGERSLKGYLLRGRITLGMLLSREIAVLTSAIAFNFLLCLFPLLLVMVAASEHLEGSRAFFALQVVIQEVIPFGRDAFAETLRNMRRVAHGFEAASLLLIVWGSSGIFIPMEMALNRAWGGRQHRDFWKSRLLAFFMTLAGGLLALLSVAITVSARGLGPKWPTLAGASAKASAALLTYLIFFLIYRVIPGAVGSRVALKASVWAGTVWELAKYVFVIQLGRLHLQTVYGPLALSVSLILWAYVSSLILVFGALMVPVEDPKPPPRRGGP